MKKRSALTRMWTTAPIRRGIMPCASGMLLIIVGLGLVTAAAADSLVYVANGDDDTVSVIDAETQTVIATVEVDTEPGRLAAHPAGTVVYVNNSSVATLSVIDTTSQEVVATVEPYLGVAQGDIAGIVEFAMHPSGSVLYAASESGLLFIIETSTHTVIETIDIQSAIDVPIILEALAIHPSGRVLYATDWPNQRVLVIDPATRTVTTTVPVDPFVWPIAIHPDGTRLYVPELEPTIAVIETAAHTVVDRIPFDLGATTGIFTANGVLERARIIDIAVHPAGTFLYVAAFRSRDHPEGEVSVIDTATQEMVDRIPVEVSPFPGGGLGIHPDGTRLYVTNFDANTLSVIDTATHTVSAVIPVGTFPENVTVVDPGVRGVAGCVTLDSLPLANRAVVLKQKGTAKQRTTTDAGGCYAFPNGRADRRLELIIKPLQ